MSIFKLFTVNFECYTPPKRLFAHASHVSFPGGVRLVIVVVQHPSLPPRVQLKGPRPSSITCMEFSHAAHAGIFGTTDPGFLSQDWHRR